MMMMMMMQKMSQTPTTTTSQKRPEIASSLYRNAPAICIAMLSAPLSPEAKEILSVLLPFESQRFLETIGGRLSALMARQGMQGRKLR